MVCLSLIYPKLSKKSSSTIWWMKEPPGPSCPDSEKTAIAYSVWYIVFDPCMVDLSEGRAWDKDFNLRIISIWNFLLDLFEKPGHGNFFPPFDLPGALLLLKKIFGQSATSKTVVAVQKMILYHDTLYLIPYTRSQFGTHGTRTHFLNPLILGFKFHYNLPSLTRWPMATGSSARQLKNANYYHHACGEKLNPSVTPVEWAYVSES